MAGCDEVATASIGAEGSSFPLIGVTGKLDTTSGDQKAWRSLYRSDMRGGALAGSWLWRNRLRRRLSIQPATWSGEQAHGKARRLDLVMQGGWSWLEHTWHDDGMGARWSGEADTTSGS